MTVQPLPLAEPTQPADLAGSRIAREELTFVLGTTMHDAVARALSGMSRSTLSLRGGVEESNDVLREIVLALALGEVGAEPLPGEYPDDEMGNVAYAEDVSRWLDAVEEVADEKTTLVSDVLRAAADVITARTGS